MTKFSLASILDFLDTVPEAEVMRMVHLLYEENQARGLFSNKLINQFDLAAYGYPGFKAMLINLFETDPDFVEQHRFELFNLTKKLKGE